MTVGNRYIFSLYDDMIRDEKRREEVEKTSSNVRAVLKLEFSNVITKFQRRQFS